MRIWRVAPRPRWIFSWKVACRATNCRPHLNRHRSPRRRCATRHRRPLPRHCQLNVTLKVNRSHPPRPLRLVSQERQWVLSTPPRQPINTCHQPEVVLRITTGMARLQHMATVYPTRRITRTPSTAAKRTLIYFPTRASPTSRAVQVKWAIMRGLMRRRSMRAVAVRLTTTRALSCATQDLAPRMCAVGSTRTQRPCVAGSFTAWTRSWPIWPLIMWAAPSRTSTSASGTTVSVRASHSRPNTSLSTTYESTRVRSRSLVRLLAVARYLQGPRTSKYTSVLTPVITSFWNNYSDLKILFVWIKEFQNL